MKIQFLCIYSRHFCRYLMFRYKLNCCNGSNQFFREIFDTIIKSDYSFLFVQNCLRNRSFISHSGYIINSMSRFLIYIATSLNICCPTFPMLSLDLLNVSLTPSQQQIYMQIVGSILFLFSSSRLIPYLFITQANQHLD